MLYFAYGSNLNPIRMLNRCPGSVFYCKYILEGYESFFSGTASIKPRVDATVSGVLYNLSLEDIDSLDAYEGISLEVYSKLFFNVVIDGEEFEAFTYMKPIDSPLIYPSIAYLDKILLGYSFWGIPSSFLLKYRSFLSIMCEKLERRI